MFLNRIGKKSLFHFMKSGLELEKFFCLFIHSFPFGTQSWTLLQNSKFACYPKNKD